MMQTAHVTETKVPLPKDLYQICFTAVNTCLFVFCFVFTCHKNQII